MLRTISYDTFIVFYCNVFNVLCCNVFLHSVVCITRYKNIQSVFCFKLQNMNIYWFLYFSGSYVAVYS
jgi:hypothetical protein